MRKSYSKTRTALLLSAAILFILSVLIFINNRVSGRSATLLQGTDKLAVLGEVSTVSNSSSLMYCVNDLLLEAQSDNLRVKNINGEIIWSQKYPGTILKMANAGANIVIIDSSNSINYYSEQGKLLWNYKSPYEITDIFTEENGSILVEYKGMKGGRAEIFTINGSKIGNISVENAFILSFSAGTSSFSISVIDISGDAVKTKIITYNFKGDILWAKNYENKLITKLNYTKNNKLLAVGEDEILSYKNGGELQGEIKTNGSIANIAMSDYLTVAVVNQKGKYYAVCYDSDMRQQSRVEIGAAPLGVFPLKNSYIVYYEDEFIILTAKGNVTALHKSNTDISRVYMTMDNKIYLVSNRKLQLLEYK